MKQLQNFQLKKNYEELSYTCMKTLKNTKIKLEKPDLNRKSRFYFSKSNYFINEKMKKLQRKQLRNWQKKRQEIKEMKKK